MNDKIIKFLEEAGFETADSEPAALQLLRFFEEEYDVKLLALLEREWLDEQLQQDITEQHFLMLREYIDEDKLDDFDHTMAQIAAYEHP